MNNSVLEIKHLTKRFSKIVANDDISLTFYSGEIYSIMGENGAGKSTFCKMLTGLYIPDKGEIIMEGQPVKINSTSVSMKLGIGMVYQERNLVNNLTGAQNIFLGHEPQKGGFLTETEAQKKAEMIREELKVDVPLDVPVSQLGAGSQQLIEIMRALSSNPKVLILDEPTASLGQGEVEPFLQFIKGLAVSLNVAVIFISHRIDEVFDISDRIAVFTDGKCVLQDRVNNLTKQQCITAMLRSDKVKPITIEQKNYSKMEKVFELRHAVYDNKRHNLQMEINKGEIVGCYGLVGSGRTECAEVICGIRKADEIEFVLDDVLVTKQKKPLDMIRLGVILTPEKRGHGVFRQMSLTENICMLFYNSKFAKKLGLIDFRAGGHFADEVLRKNEVRYKSRNQNIEELSGGNIQKVIIGRSIEIENCKLLILDEPTNGMDIGAKHEVYQKMLKIVSDNKVGILFISSELDELIAICDKIYIFSDGNVVSSVKREDFNKGMILSEAIKRREYEAFQ